MDQGLGRCIQDLEVLFGSTDEVGVDIARQDVSEEATRGRHGRKSTTATARVQETVRGSKRLALLL